MNISPRLTKIFKILLALPPDKTMTTKELASLMNISRRTLFRELESARYILDDCHMMLITRPGLQLQGDPALLQQKLEGGHALALNREERQDMLLYELLKTKQAEKLVVYAARMQVSEATISHDLEEIRQRIALYGLRLEKNGTITGDEEAIRQVMAMLVRDGVEYKTVDYLDPDTVLEQVFQGSAILQLLDQDLLKRILTLLSTKREELGFARYEQNSYIGLVIHLVIALERIQSGDAASEPLTDLPDMEDSLKEAARLAKLLEAEFDVKIPQAEVDAIALHLKGAKTSTVNAAPAQNEILDLARLFVEGFPAQDAALLSTDGQFIQGLISHLEPTVIRLRGHHPIYNPLLGTLKEQYGDLFERTRQASKAMETALGIPLSEEEIGFLTMHVGACFERCGRHDCRKVRGAVVCASGIGVSSLLCARLEKAFASQLELENLSVSQAKKRDDLELFITTFATEKMPGISVEVSPMLGPADLRKIQEQLAVLQSKPAPAAISDSNFELELDRLQECIEAIKPLSTGIPLVHVPPESARELITLAASHMQGNISRIEEDLWRREQLGPVVAQEEAFGLYHAATEGTDHIQAVVLLPETGTFYDGLRVILVTVMPKVHTRAMQEVLSMLNRSLAQEDAFRQVLMDGPDEKRQQAVQRLLTDYIRNTKDTAGF